MSILHIFLKFSSKSTNAFKIRKHFFEIHELFLTEEQIFIFMNILLIR
jgi:hypothetical protein